MNVTDAPEVTLTLVAGLVEEDDGNKLVLAINLFFLFCLLMGMAASVDTVHFENNFRKPKALVIGLLCQFIVLPLLGYAAVNIMHVSSITSIALLLTTMAPGGAFSNLFCSLFNADLSLSVAMTTMATLCSMGVLPLNMFLYIELLTESDVNLDWPSLITSVATASAGLMTGVAISKYRPEWRGKCNVAATIAALCLMVFGFVTSTNSAPIWDRPAQFYPQVLFPCAASIVVSAMVCFLTGIPGPQAIAIIIECSYQNTGLSTSFVLANFKGTARAEALGVPIFYGTAQFLLVILTGVVGWKTGKTYAPADTKLRTLLSLNFQPASDATPPTGAKVCAGDASRKPIDNPIAALDDAPIELGIAGIDIKMQDEEVFSNSTISPTVKPCSTTGLAAGPQFDSVLANSLYEEACRSPISPPLPPRLSTHVFP